LTKLADQHAGLLTDRELPELALTLLTDPALEFVKRIEIKASKPPGVVIWNQRTFAYAYQENPTAFVYRETVALMHVTFAKTENVTAAAYQDRVQAWVLECFGPEIAYDALERSFRFLEEALELAQSRGCTQEQAERLVSYVYGRPAGASEQEVGGVMVTLAALCSAAGIDLDKAAETELARVNAADVIEKIRRKQAAKRGVVSHVAEAALPGRWTVEPDARD
jgi:hypothetical protein